MRTPQLSVFKNKHIMALVGNVVIAVFGVLTMSLLLRTMTKTNVGIWFFFLSIYSLSDALRNGFLSTGTIKFYAGVNKERGDAVLGSVWVLAVGASLVLMLLDLCAMPFISIIKNEEIILVIKWFGVTVLSSVVFNVTFWILVADEDYLTILWLRFVNSGTMILALCVMVIIKKGSLEHVLIINFATNILTSLACLVFGYSRIDTFFKYTGKCMMELVNFGKYSLATNLSSTLLGNANTYVIMFMFGPVAGAAILAVYTVPLKLMEIIEILLRTFIGTGMSGMAMALNNNDMPQLTYISKKYAGMLTYLFIPLAIGAFFLSDFAIWLLSGDQYKGTEAANIFRIFMFMAILYPIDRFNGVTLDIIHQPQINFYKVIIMLVSGVLASITGIYFLQNIYGAAFASPIPIVAGLAFGYYHLKKHLNNYSIKSIMVTGWVEGKLLIAQTLSKVGLAKA